jgi:hypothetical protein
MQEVKNTYYPFIIVYLFLKSDPDGHKEVKRVFGVLFIAIAIAIGAATILSEIAFVNKEPFYYYAIISILSFGITFGIIFGKSRKLMSSIRDRMKQSVKWSTGVKALNGICWAGPFAAIAAFPSLYQYLILLGIGLGNFSTYLLMKRYSGLDNREQMIVGLISLTAVPIVVEINTTLFIARQDIAIMLSRILISLAYGMGGIYGIITK